MVCAMKSFKEFNIVNILTWVLIILTFFLVIKFNWQRRWLYYHGSKFHGSLTFSLIGQIKLIAGGYTGFMGNLMEFVRVNPPIFKFWMAGDLFIINSRPESVEILLNTSLEKTEYFKFSKEFLYDGLLTAPVDIWKRHRKIINPTFNPKIINSFIETFAKFANKLVEDVEQNCGRGPVAMLTKIWKRTLDIALETLIDVDPELITGQDQYVSTMIRLEELIAIRTFRIWLHPKFFWELSSFSKEMHKLSRITLDFTEQVIRKKKLLEENRKDETLYDNDKHKRFFNHIAEKLNNGEFTERNVLEETQIMMITASETTALVLSFTLLVLGIHTEVQEKICAELDSIFGSSTRDATLEDINRMDYLERVMKESMRLLPPIPMIVRFLDKDVKIDQHVFPKRSSLLVPILHMNRRPELWDDPLTFNPDRFLPEQSKNRPRCAYIPFSFGFRNCIGLQYGMISVKAILSTFLRRYEVGSVNYKSIADIEMIFTELAKPKDNCEILLKSRN